MLINKFYQKLNFHNHPSIARKQHFKLLIIKYQNVEKNENEKKKLIKIWNFLFDKFTFLIRITFNNQK